MDLVNYSKRFLFSAILLLPIMVMAQQTQQAPNVGNPEFENKLGSLLSFSVPIVSVTQLEEMEDVYILDAREQQEYDISHIPGAQYIGYDKPDWSVLDDIPSDGKIVLYCSVGYRSEKLGEKVQEKGFSKVYNLYGSIFEWANVGLPIIDKDGNPTNQVHTYNKRWSQWLTNPDMEKTW